MQIARAWSQLTIKSASEDDAAERIIEGIATTPSTDRSGDIVEPLGGEWKEPVPLLVHHDSEKPIGHLTSIKATKDGIVIKGRIVKDSGLGYVDQAWKQIKAGLVRGLSIGFVPKEYSFMKDGGIHFTKWSLLELSAVTIPANADCSIAAIKSLDIAAGSPRPKAAHPGRPASPNTPPKGAAMHVSLSDRIKAAQAALNDLRDKYTNAIGRQDDDNPDDGIAAEIAELDDQIGRREANLEQLLAAEKRIAAGGSSPSLPAAPREDRSTPVQAAREQALKQVLEDRRPRPADLLFKIAAVSVLAHCHKAHPMQVVEDRYRADPNFVEFIKSTTNPAMTTVPAWAGALVQTAVGDFMDLLEPISAFPKLAALGTTLTFGENKGAIKIPFRTDDHQLRGSFVGEGDPIPVRQASLNSLVIGPKKMAVISVFTREMGSYSSPTIESLIRSFMIADTAIAIDTALLDALPVTPIRPAGLFNGVTPATGSGGTTMDNIITDLKSLLGHFTPTVEGRRLAWLMNPLQALTLSLVTTPAGNFLFPGISFSGGSLLNLPVIISSKVAAGTVALADLTSFFTAAGGPNITTSDQATLHMESGLLGADQAEPQPASTVKPIIGGTTAAPVPAAPVRSLWQTDSIGVRYTQEMNWGLNRATSIFSVTVAW
jgi:HK97 family phage major capsid protein/HK97 family phage prohead protease